MKRIILLAFLFLIIPDTVFCQQDFKSGSRILFHGLVSDASTLIPLSNSQIFINKKFSSVSSEDGTFVFYVNRNDTVVFSRIGYKSTHLYVSDTLTAKEFIAGIYLHADTISIGEVIIVPKLTNLKNELLNSRPQTNIQMENAKYNIAVSSYIGRNSKNKLGDPATNYQLLRQKQWTEAYERGNILPSENMIGLNPLLLIPAAYHLMHGRPEKDLPFNPQLTDEEIDQIHSKYIETLKQRK